MAEGYQRGEFSITPETITISGQEELVDQVQYAQVTVSQQELTSTYSEQCPVTLIDPNGNPITGANIQAQPETVLVTLPVEILKEVPLTVNLIDGGGATADNAKVTFSPTDTIMVSGDQADVEGLKEISLGTSSWPMCTAPMCLPRRSNSPRADQRQRHYRSECDGDHPWAGHPYHEGGQHRDHQHPRRL